LPSSFLAAFVGTTLHPDLKMLRITAHFLQNRRNVRIRFLVPAPSSLQMRAKTQNRT